MKKSSLLLLLVLIMLSCNKTVIIPKEQVIDKYKHYEVEAPQWFFNPPQNPNFAIGIVSKHPSKAHMEEAAKSEAAVFLSRNQSSYVVSKVAMTSGLSGDFDSQANFDVNVSTDIPKLKKIKKSLKLIDSFILSGHYVGLFSLKKANPSKNMIKTDLRNDPNWFNNEVYIENNKVISCSQSSASNLGNAWNDALSKARLKLGIYYGKKVQSMVLSVDENIKKSIAMETVENLEHTYLSNVGVDVQFYDNHFRYVVWVKMQNQVL